MASHVFSAQIRPIVNWVILKMPRHLALFYSLCLPYIVFSLLLQCTLHQILMNHFRRGKRMPLSQGGLSFSKFIFYLLTNSWNILRTHNFKLLPVFFVSFFFSHLIMFIITFLLRSRHKYSHIILGKSENQCVPNSCDISKWQRSAMISDFWQKFILCDCFVVNMKNSWKFYANYIFDM